MHDRERETERSAPGWKLPVAGLVVVLFVGVGTYVPRPPDPDLLFGLDRYRELGPVPFPVAAALLVAILLLPGLANRLAELLGGLRAVPPAAGAILTVAFAGAAFWFLPNYCLSGDAGTVLFLATVGDVHPSNALTSWLLSGTAEILALDPVIAIRLVSTLAGMVYAAAAVGLGRECFDPGARRVGLTAVLLTTGTVALFFGTIEVYAPLVAAIAVFLLLGIRYLNGKGRGIAPALCLGVAFVLHGSAGLLLPALLVLAGRGRLRPLPIRRGILFGLLFLIPVAVVFAGLWFGTWEGTPPPPGPGLTGTFLGAGDQGPILPLVRSPHDPTRRYAMLDPEHLAAVANVFLLVVPVGLALLAIGRVRLKDPVHAFVGVAALFLVLFPFFWNVSYDLSRDWDLFSSLGVPVALLGGLAVFAGRASGADALRIAALGLFCLAPFALGNHVLTRHRLLYADIAGYTVGSAIRKVAQREGARAALDAARADGTAAPDLPPVEWRTSLESFGGALLERAGAFSPGDWWECVDEVGPRLEGILARRTFRDEHRGDPTALAEAVIDGLRGEIEQSRARRQPVPPAHLVAFFAVQRAVAGSRGGDTLPSNLDLVLLDALDEALEDLGAYGPAELGVDEEVLRTEAERGFEASLDRLSFDAGRWAELLSDGLMAATGSGPEGERVRRLIAARDRWKSIERSLRPPGQPEACSRMEWLWTNANDLQNAERLARRGLERDPGKARWLDLLGGVLIARGRNPEGREVLRRALAADPQRLLSRIRLADDLIARGDKDEALELLLRGLRICGYYSEVTTALVQLGWLRVDRGEMDLARSALEAAIRRLDAQAPSPENDDLRNKAEALLDRAGR